MAHVHATTGCYCPSQQALARGPSSFRFLSAFQRFSVSAFPFDARCTLVTLQFPVVASGTQAAAQDGLGIDYNNDGRGIGFNVPSLLGLYAVPPFMHNGAAECLAAVVADVKHRTDNGRLPDFLSSPSDQAKVVAFLESIDLGTVPFVPIVVERQGANLILSFDSVAGVVHGIQARDQITGQAFSVGSTNGTGQRISVSVPIVGARRFYHLGQ